MRAMSGAGARRVESGAKVSRGGARMRPAPVTGVGACALRRSKGCSSRGQSDNPRPVLGRRSACAPANIAVRNFPDGRAAPNGGERWRMPVDPRRRQRMDAVASGTPAHYSFEEKRQRVFAIMAASSGNLVEWFDFYTYAFCAIYFAPAFFPKGDQTAQLLNAAGVFAAGFLMRPIGGWIFGKIADRKGRRTSLVISVLMMCAGSLLIACLPTYASIGALAPALPLFARLVQGTSVGGEYGATATYMSEVALRGQRGFFSSFQYVTLIGGQLLAVFVIFLLQQWLTEAELKAWGWRVPFVVGAITAVIALYLRRSLHETTTEAERTSQ